jgi:hypothetical protein
MRIIRRIRGWWYKLYNLLIYKKCCMPINRPTEGSAPIYYPKTDYPIVKYLDLTKFISILQRRAMFFCRMDKLEDQFEGTTAKRNFDLRVKYKQELRDSGFYEIDMPDDRIIKEVKEYYEWEKKSKSLNCINCWNNSSTESAALWKIYSDFSKGIMIKSSVLAVVKSFEKSKDEIFISEVEYLDYDNDTMPDGNTFFPLIHKQLAYNYEKEVRLIYNIQPDKGWDFDWSKEEINEGKYIECDPNHLIKEIILSPYSPKWYFDLIEDISNKYGLNIPIKKSKLSILP